MQTWKEEILKKWNKVQRTFSVNDALRDRLARELRGEILYSEPMDRFTSIRIGGRADVLIKPANLDDLANSIKIASQEEIPFYILGAGSNTLVKDGGFRGFVIMPGGALKTVRIEQEMGDVADVYVEAGVGITAFVNFCAQHSLTGQEPLVGIPGSIGGAIAMNAGARGVEISDLARVVSLIDGTGTIEKIPREKLEFSYRNLKLSKKSIIVAGLFRLNLGNTDEIAARIREYQMKRVETQPLNFPNLGSVFKNPQPTKKGEVVAGAGKLIEEAGLKNIRVGGARVSEKHANFIINEKNATARDVTVLINLIRDKVKESSGILLETEIKIVGEDS